MSLGDVMERMRNTSFAQNRQDMPDLQCHRRHFAPFWVDTLRQKDVP
jgi:hypothetical protein